MPLIILDRDGVINEDSDAYIKSVDEWIPIPGSLRAIAKLNRAGYFVVVVTNQSGIARGLFTLETLNQIHQHMIDAAAAEGGAIDTIFFCPHGPADGCECRKPKAGLMRDVEARFATSLRGVPAVGDSLRDIQAAAAVGARPILVRTGKGERTIAAGKGLEGVEIYADLAAFVEALLGTSYESA